MDVLDIIYDKACCELEEIGKKDKLDSKDVELMDKFVDIMKDIEEMNMPQDMGYSQMGGSYNNGGNRGSSYNNGNSMRERSSRGSSYRNGNRSYGRMSMNGYSRDESKDMMLDTLQDVMDMAVDEKDRKAVERLMQQMEQQR